MEQERIPFDIKYRPEIEAGKYLVETREGEPVRIICWDRRGVEPIVALIGDGRLEEVDTFYTNGVYIRGKQSVHDLSLIPNPDYKEPTTTCSTSVDWDAFRREAAKDILCALITSDMAGAPEEKSRWSIDAADELIKQLKEGKK